MLIFKFDNSDLDRAAKVFHNSLEVSYGGMAEATISEYIDCFRSFLIAMSFGPEMVDGALGLTGTPQNGHENMSM